MKITPNPMEGARNMVSKERVTIYPGKHVDPVSIESEARYNRLSRTREHSRPIVIILTLLNRATRPGLIER